MTDQVICVDDSLPHDGWGVCEPVVKGEVYTIRSIVDNVLWDGPAYLLHEVCAGFAVLPGGEISRLEDAYRVDRFRPYTAPPATDIEIFREIDRKVFERKRVDA